MTSFLTISSSRSKVEIRSLFRNRQQLVFTIFFPVLLLLIFGSVFTSSVLPGIKFAQYFTAGIIASGVVYTAFQNLAIAIPMERDAGTLKRLRGTPMPAAAYFMGKIAQVVISYIFQVTILILVGAVFFGVHLPTNATAWINFVWISLLGLLCFTLLGISFSSLAKNGDSAPALVTPVVLVAQFTSGVFIQFNTLPTWMQDAASIFPLKWMCEGMRSVFLGSKATALQPHGSYQLGDVALMLVLWSVIGGVLAWRTFRFVDKS
jgi:ABC-2 type transport system permease protein